MSYSKKILFYDGHEALAYSDVYLYPTYSDIKSRYGDQLTTSSKITKKLILNIPLISAGMDTVTEDKMAIKIALLGGIGEIHRNNNPNRQAELVAKVKKHKIENKNLAAVDSKGRLLSGAAIGVQEIDVERAYKLIEAEVDVMFIDIAHGHSIHTEKMINKLKKENIAVPIIVGNIATKEAAKFAYEIGADGVKVGIGPGYVCKTRNVAGVGIPQVTAIMEVKNELSKKKNTLPIIADGGIREPGDVAKAIASGADTVMIGSLLAGTEESPGKLITENGVKKKMVRGMASSSALKDRKKLGDSTTNQKLYSPEGRETYVDYKGSVEAIINEYTSGLRSAMSYTGSHSIKELQEARLIRVSSNGAKEQVRSLS